MTSIAWVERNFSWNGILNKKDVSSDWMIVILTKSQISGWGKFHQWHKSHGLVRRHFWILKGIRKAMYATRNPKKKLRDSAFRICWSHVRAYLQTPPNALDTSHWCMQTGATNITSHDWSGAILKNDTQLVSNGKPEIIKCPPRTRTCKMRSPWPSGPQMFSHLIDHYCFTLFLVIEVFLAQTPLSKCCLRSCNICRRFKSDWIAASVFTFNTPISQIPQCAFSRFQNTPH